MNIRKHIPLIFIVGLGIFLRLYALGKIPVSLTDDEVRIAGSAYMIAETGKDAYGKPWPLSFPLDGFAQNPIPIYITALSIKAFGPSMFAIRLPAAVMGIMSIVLIYILANTVLPKSKSGVYAAMVLAFNVWHIQISRFTHEGAFALFFYLLSITVLVSPKQSYRKLLFGGLSLIFAFYSYHATKLLLVPVSLLLCIPLWKRNMKLSVAAIIITVCIAFGSLFILSKIQHATDYGGTTFFFQDPTVAATAVELERRVSSAPTLIMTIYRNKFAYWARIFVRHYLYAFSPQYLFLDQEGSGIYAVWFRGQFYLIEAPLLVLGWLYLLSKKRTTWFWLCAFTAITPLASAVGPGEPSYTMRSILLLPALTIYIGIGIAALFEKTVVPTSWQKLILLILIISYTAHLTGYISQYYFDWSRYGARYYSYDTRLMIEKAAMEIQNGHDVIVAPANANIFLQWALYQKRNASSIQHALINNQTQDGKLLMRPTCLPFETREPYLSIPDNAVYIAQPHCTGKLKPDETLINLDRQTAWNIYRQSQ